MQRKSIARLTVASLAAMAITAPAAIAMPTDPAGTGPRQTDLYGSTVHKPQQDQRGEATKPGSGPAAQKPQTDFRGEATKPQNRAPARPPLGMPTWPMYPTPLTPPAQAPVAADGGNGIGGDDDVPVVLLVIAGALALGGAAAATGLRLRARTHTAH